MTKNILLVSNMKPNEKGIGNPIMLRMKKAFEENQRVGKVEFLPFENNFKDLLNIRRKAKNFDIVHVHFGGMYALIVWIILYGLKKTKFITFHGTDIHAKSLKTAKSAKLRLKIRLNQKASFACIRLYDKCGMVAKEMIHYVPQELRDKYKTKFFVQKLGVDYDSFVPSTTSEAQRFLGLEKGHYVLFSDVANTPIKRRDLAEAIIRQMGMDYKLLLMCGVKPNFVPAYINAADFILLTSDEEGSPNIVREGLALNKRIYSVDVGDVAKQLAGLNNSLVIGRNPQIAAKQILENLNVDYTDNTRISHQEILDFTCINEKIIELYENC